MWAHLQYVAGLARLGHEVWFVEEAGWEDSCFDPVREVMTSDPSHGLGVLRAIMARFGLERRWAYRDWAGEWHGHTGEEVDDLIVGADLFLDVGGSCYFPQMAGARHRAYVDMDPVFTQMQAFGNDTRLGEYDTLFTYGTQIGRRASRVPTLGFDWQPLLPPVVLSAWDEAPAEPPPGARWTTVAHWTAYGAIEYEGESYGQKDVEFLRFIDLPTRTPSPIEVAVSLDDVPLDLFQANGWHLQPSLPVSVDPWEYRDYVWRSRGEFSVAKEAYAKARCGWFSDRTATYLASGRPAVVQDTGLGGLIPTGEGLLVFRDKNEAVHALASAEGSYAVHSQAARQIARDYLDSDKVLTGLLERCGL